MIKSRTIIFYFSATGNSFFVAKSLSEKIENTEIQSMTNALPEGEIGGDNCRIGFVFPVYYGKLPRLVKSFIERLKIKPDTYCFAVATSGSPSFICSGVLLFIDEILKTKDIKLSYGETVDMVDNYIIAYGAPENEKIQTKLNKASLKIEKITRNIKNAHHANLKGVKLSLNKLYKNISSLDNKFHVEDHCNGCGQCERICPVENIKLIDKKPVWQHHCEHCVACIQWCPQLAIQYGNKTKNRRRYHNPNVSIIDLIAKK